MVAVEVALTNDGTDVSKIVAVSVNEMVVVSSGKKLVMVVSVKFASLVKAVTA